MPKLQVCQLHVDTTSEANASAFLSQQNSFPGTPKRGDNDLSAANKKGISRYMPMNKNADHIKDLFCILGTAIIPPQLKNPHSHVSVLLDLMEHYRFAHS